MATPNPNCGESFATPVLEGHYQAVRWASDVDPDLWQPRRSRMVAVGLDGAFDLHGIIAADERLDEVPAGTAELLRLEGDDPSDVANPLLVLSGAARGMFLLGGTMGESGYPSPDVWFHPFPGPWRRLPATLDSEAVVAATYSFADDHVWAIVAPADQAYPWQLLRIDPFTGQKDEVYRFHYRSGARPILSVARDGAVVVSMTRALDTKQAAFWSSGAAAYGQRVEAIAGQLHRPMIVDEHEVSQVLETPSGLQVSRIPDVTRVGAVEACPCDDTFGDHL